jgi:hypothetical protein
LVLENAVQGDHHPAVLPAVCQQMAEQKKTVGRAGGKQLHGVTTSAVVVGWCLRMLCRGTTTQLSCLWASELDTRDSGVHQRTCGLTWWCEQLSCRHDCRWHHRPLVMTHVPSRQKSPTLLFRNNPICSLG